VAETYLVDGEDDHQRSAEEQGGNCAQDADAEDSPSDVRMTPAFGHHHQEVTGQPDERRIDG